MHNLTLKNPNQKDAYTSPWNKREAIKIRVWEVVWVLLVCWLPKPFFRWHLLLLRLFGCKIKGRPFIAPTARIYAPWLLEIGHHSCLATRSEVYNLGPVKIGERTTIAQYAYICNGTHDMCTPVMPLLVGNIEIGNDVFIGAKSLLLPGVIIGDGAVVGAGAVVTKDVEPWTVVGGNPAKFLKKRVIKDGMERR